MKWRITTPPPSRVVTWEEAKAHNHYPDADQTAVELMIDAATDYAEDAMECSLVARTITATFYEGEKIRLPRGPVASITSITDADEKNVTLYEIERFGLTDSLKFTESFKYPLTVVYRAGCTGAANVSPAIRLAILTHVGTLYENRESATDLNLRPVPHSLEAFYRLKRRGVGVG